MKGSYNFEKILQNSLRISYRFLVLSVSINAEAASSATVDLGDGYSGRIGRPHDTKTGKWHGYVYKKGKQIGAENVDGTKHDGKTFKDFTKKSWIS